MGGGRRRGRTARGEQRARRTVQGGRGDFGPVPSSVRVTVIAKACPATGARTVCGADPEQHRHQRHGSTGAGVLLRCSTPDGCSWYAVRPTGYAVVDVFGRTGLLRSGIRGHADPEAAIVLVHSQSLRL